MQNNIIKEVLLSRIYDIVLSTVFFVIYIYRKIQFEWRFRNRKFFLVSPDILFSNDLNWWRKFIHSNGKSYKDDIILGEIIRKIKNRHKNISCLDISILRRSYKNIGDKFDKSSDWVPLEHFVTFKNLFLSYILALRTLLNLQEKIDDSYFLGCVGQIKNTFRTIFSLTIAENVIKILNPKCVFTACEYLHMSRAITLTAKKSNITVFAAQHGNIFKINRGYFFSDHDSELLKNRLPDYTFVYSEQVKKLLTKESIYNDEGVLVVGNPRYDLFAHADEIYSKDDILHDYELPENKHYILWTAFCRYLPDGENIRALEAIKKSISNLDDIVFLIKPHPNDGNKYTRMMEKYLDLPNDRIVLLPQMADTNALIYCSDIVITKTSSTANEAVALNKPVIVLDLSGRYDKNIYVETGIALGVYKQEDLTKGIICLLEDDSELKKNRKGYIKRHLYKIDGKAADRVVNNVANII